MKSFKQFLKEDTNKKYEIQIFWEDPDDEGEFNDFYTVEAPNTVEALKLAKKKFREENGNRVKFLKHDTELKEDAPINNVGSGNVAGVNLPMGKMVKRKLIKTEDDFKKE